ncbi:MAG TPA: hypothetical protein VK756_01960 [Solirubrobacteraceae bacterium]|jgi:hypothetical protein|nr:hypothetical protein [Solirubrobacteraceae bacterium]
MTWLGYQLGRPLAEHERRAAIAVLCLLLLVAAVALVLTRPAKPAAANAGHEHRSHVSPAARMPAIHALTPATKATVETFLGGFLQYIYGRTPVGAVSDATSALITSLEQHPPQVPQGLRALKPRVVDVLAAPAPSGRLEVTAIVSDEEAVDYRISLGLTTSRGHELVAELDPQ